MEIYNKIKSDVRDSLRKEGNEDLAKNSSKIIEAYLNSIIDELCISGSAQISPIKASLYITTRPMAYIVLSMYKNMMVSNLNSNYVFEIKMKSKSLKANKFSFKPMSKLKYFFKKRGLDTERVYNLIEKYEKSII